MDRWIDIGFKTQVKCSWQKPGDRYVGADYQLLPTMLYT